MILNKNAVRFKSNVEKEINNYLSASSPEDKTFGKKGARYECIYKNLLREVRQYYAKKYELFLQEHNVQNLMKMCKTKYIIYPYLILKFTKQIFSKELIAKFMPDSDQLEDQD